MKEQQGGGPLPGPTARTLGVRPGADLPVDSGMVHPATGGMSVAPDQPSNLPSHRRPPHLGGTGKDPVWGIDSQALGDGLVFRQDKVDHGVIEPARSMPLAEFQGALADLAPRWIKQ